MKTNSKIKVALADDHVLLRQGLAGLIDSFDNYQVIVQADNGMDLQEKLDAKAQPDIALLDINMPRMDGFETANWLKQTYPLVRIVSLSMYDHENSVIRMFKAGARGYILKDCEPAELKQALDSVMEKGYYYSELVTGKLIHTINQLEANDDIKGVAQLNEREIQFLRLACTEMTYKEIAEQMTTKNYRVYFDKNRENNIQTFQDLEILEHLNG